MTEQTSGAASGNVVDQAEIGKLNEAAVAGAQQVVDLTSKVRAEKGMSELAPNPSGMQPEYEVGFSTDDPTLPVIVMRAAGHGSDRTGDMVSADAVSWSVSAHIPKKMQSGTHHHVNADLSVNVTASSANTNVPNTEVHNPWYDSLGQADQFDVEARQARGDEPEVGDYAARSRESALAIMRQHVDVGGYQVPEEATGDALSTAIANPVGLKVNPAWFAKNVGTPVAERLALASALELMQGAKQADSPAQVIDNAVQAQNLITNPALSGALFLPSGPQY